MACNSGCNTCNTGCNTCPQTNPCATKCKSQITSADLAELVYIAGLDINLCKKYSTIIDALGLTDCEDNPIAAGTPIVTCAEFQTQFCELLTALTAGGPVGPGTVLVGADCLTHVMPAFQGPISVADTTCIDMTLAGDIISAVPIISPTAGNILECTLTGLYADVCTGIENLTAGAVIAAGTVLVGDDCLTHEMPAFQSPITVLDTPCIDLTFAANVLSAVPVISPAVDNVLECTPGGLYVPEAVIPAETPITPIDTNSVNITVSGVNDHTIQADVIISPTAGNATEILANGVYTPDVCTQFGDIGGIVLPAEVGDIFITNTCTPRTLPANGGITVDDTITIDLTLAAGVVTGDVNVSSVPDNILEIRPDGLAVRCTSVVDCITPATVLGTDTNCFDISVVEAPANTFTVSGSPVISPTLGNVLTCTANGLYVPTAGPAGEITCEAIQTLFVDNPAVISPGQRILVDDCQTYLSPTYTPLDTNSIDMVITENGAGDPVFSANAILAPQATGFPVGCNGLESTVLGLASPPNSTGNQAIIFSNTVLYNGGLIEGQVVTSATFTVNISNPSDCREAVLSLQAVYPQIATSNIQPGTYLLQAQMYETYNLPGILVTPSTLRAAEQLTDTDTSAVIPRLGPDSWPGVLPSQFVVPASFVGSYSVTLVITQLIGDGDILVNNPGISYTLFTI